jgi:hypothetical protein
MHRIITGFSMALLLALAACGDAPVDPQADELGRTAFRALQRGDWRVLQPLLSPAAAQDPETPARMEALRRDLPLQAPTAVEVVEWRPSGPAGAAAGQGASISYRYDFAARSVIVKVSLARDGGRLSVADIEVAPAPVAIGAPPRT